MDPRRLHRRDVPRPDLARARSHRRRVPLLWGTEQHLSDLFGDSAAGLRSRRRTFTFRFTSPEDFVGFFRRWYGPTLKAFEALDDRGRTSLAADLVDLAQRCDRNRDGGSIALPSAYLETVLTLR